MFVTRSLLKRLVLGTLVLLAVIQLVPYGRSHANPVEKKPVTLASPAARKIFAGACADCHSNLTRWPWYTNVAPASWLVQNDVEGGRKALNLSRWDTPQAALGQVADKISSGEMPPLKYRIMPNHADARLSASEKATLIAAMRNLYAAHPPVAIRRGGDG